MSLQDFCLLAKQLLTAKMYEEFVKMVLCGIHDGQQIIVDPILDKMDDYETFTGTRDYDSLIGISENIQVSAPLTVYPVAKRTDTLTRDIHIKHKFQTNNVSLKIIPNTELR